MHSGTRFIAACWQEVSQAIESKQEKPKIYDRFFIGSIQKQAPTRVRHRKSSTQRSVILKGCLYFSEPIGSVALTRREAEVLIYICQGHTNIEAAHKMSLSPRTIEYYIKNMRKKTRTMSKRHLVSQVLKTDFLERVKSDELFRTL